MFPLPHTFKKYFLKKGGRFSPDREPEPHEIFFYAEKQRMSSEGEEFSEERLELPLHGNFLTMLFFVIGAILLILGGRLLFLAIIQHETYSELARSNLERVTLLRSPRGILYDRFKQALVVNKKTYNVLFDGRIAKSLKNEEIMILSDILAIQPDELQTRIKKEKGKPVLLSSAVSRDVFLRITAGLPSESGIRVEPTYVREYLDPYAFSHALGYTGYVNEENLQGNSNFSLRDLVGKNGVESEYDAYIRGENGKIITRINSRNEIVGEVSTEEPVPGKDLLLAIDAELQIKIHEIFKKKGVERGAAVALDPATGEVLALVSVPGFDSNEFSRGMNAREFQRIVEDKTKPLFSRAISGHYPPGSTIKPFVALAALGERIIDPNRYIYAAASISVPNIYNPEIVYRFSDWKEHGLVNMVKAIAVSSNVYFYHIGGGYGDVKGLGIERLARYLTAFGFGKILGIDVKSEAQGFIPDPAWKKEARGEDWYIGDTYNASIGQGDISVTPLQLASATAAIANGGILWKPRIVNAVIDTDGTPEKEFPAEQLLRFPVSENNLKVVREGMREAVRSGSSKFLSDLPFAVAGKTGTAQAGTNKTPHAWWTGFAPYENPEIVLTILVENGGEGSAVSVPIAKDVLNWYFENRK